jgi:hypothetical protein
MKTDLFIERLAHDIEPVTPLRRPWIRAAIWVAGTVLYLAVLTWIMASPADVAANSTGWPLLFPQVAAIVTAIAAAATAFATIVPGYSRRPLLLPALAAAVWFGSLAIWSLPDWNREVVGAAAPGEWLCVGMIVFGGALPGLVLTLMLRRGAPLAPRTTAALGVLAVAALANVAACISRPHPNHAVTLVWHGAAIAALVWLAAWTGRSVLAWERVRRRAVRF